MATVEHTRPIRAGVFETVEAATRAIRGLRKAGFQRGEISVVCNGAECGEELSA